MFRDTYHKPSKYQRSQTQAYRYTTISEIIILDTPPSTIHRYQPFFHPFCLVQKRKGVWFEG